MHLQVPSVEWPHMQGTARGERSSKVATRVSGARARAVGRSVACNAELSPSGVARHCAPTATAEALLGAAVERLRISVRGYHRILKVARTIADLAGSERLLPDHVAEAIQYRTPAGSPN